uniref:Uncharacterized protein n=1 Tax=Timema bartmani TaxID=61472 RepID=A0A7R9I105_9NEOP|nr:unnamed protein product [Timema bartmani]
MALKQNKDEQANIGKKAKACGALATCDETVCFKDWHHFSSNLPASTSELLGIVSYCPFGSYAQHQLNFVVLTDSNCAVLKEGFPFMRLLARCRAMQLSLNPLDSGYTILKRKHYYILPNDPSCFPINLLPPLTPFFLITRAAPPVFKLTSRQWFNYKITETISLGEV